MLINEDELRANIVGKLKQWVDVIPDPNKPIIGVLGERMRPETLSPNDILDQVQRRTAVGEQLVQHWIHLAVDHIMRSELLREGRNDQQNGIRAGLASSRTGAS